MREAIADTSNSAEDSPATLHRARVLRPWRILLVIYGLALTTGTHWPRLELGPEIPATDKTIHMLAFGTLTLLLWRSGWFGPRWLIMLVALAWAGIDETSQGIPGLGRDASWYDMLGDACGVVSAIALLWAMRPLQDSEQLAGPNQAGAQLFEFTFDEMFSHRRPWIIGASVGLVSATIVLIARPLMPSPRAVGIFGLVVAIVAVHALYLIYRRIFFGMFARVRNEKPCLTCGAEQSAKRQATLGAFVCGVCGADRVEAAYALPPRPSFQAVVRVSMLPALVAFAGIATMFAMVLVLPYFYGLTVAKPHSHSVLPRLAQVVGRLPPELNSVIDLTVYLLLIAVVVRLWRVRMAAHIDRGVRCRKCGHDLHGTPINERGEGHCGECGTLFVREMNHKDTETQRAT